MTRIIQKILALLYTPSETKLTRMELDTIAELLSVQTEVEFDKLSTLAAYAKQPSAPQRARDWYEGNREQLQQICRSRTEAEEGLGSPGNAETRVTLNNLIQELTDDFYRRFLPSDLDRLLYPLASR